jgi:hypothetical protein
VDSTSDDEDDYDLLDGYGSNTGLMSSSTKDLPNVSGRPPLVNGSRGVVIGFVEVPVSLSRMQSLPPLHSVVNGQPPVPAHSALGLLAGMSGRMLMFHEEVSDCASEFVLLLYPGLEG